MGSTKKKGARPKTKSGKPRAPKGGKIKPTQLGAAEPEVAFQILALNIEKAHNLREKSLEVHRMYVELARLEPSRAEVDYELQFEEPTLCTLGFAYAERGRLSGGAYQSFLKKVDGFS